MNRCNGDLITMMIEEFPDSANKGRIITNTRYMASVVSHGLKEVLELGN